MKRFFDILFALLIGAVVIIPFSFVAILVKVTSKGTVLYWSDRVGKNNQIFKMPKFRSILFILAKS